MHPPPLLFFLFKDSDITKYDMNLNLTRALLLHDGELLTVEGSALYICTTMYWWVMI